MQPNAAWALQAALYQTLTGNTDLTALLGGARVFDQVPRHAAFPYISFGETLTTDWSTGEAPGAEHIVTLHVWSQQHGRKQTQEITAAIRTVLHDAALTLQGHHLVNLRHESSVAERHEDGETYEARMRFRAVTEPAD